MGRGWIEALDPKTSRRRLDNPQDFVRIEVRKALVRGIPVVPVLLDGAQMPEAEQLPEDLLRLIRRNAEFIEHRTVDTDVERLIRKLGLLERSEPATSTVQVERSQPIVTPTSPPSDGRAITSLPLARDDRLREEDRIVINAVDVRNANGKQFKPGNGKAEWFKDHEHGPEMVIVPAGSFMMGSSEREPERSSDAESPYHKVTIARAFAAGRHAVTRGQFAAFVNSTGYKIEGGASRWTGGDSAQRVGLATAPAATLGNQSSPSAVRVDEWPNAFSGTARKPEQLRRGHFTCEGLPTRLKAFSGPGQNRPVKEAASTTANPKDRVSAGRGTSETTTLLCRRCSHGRQPPLVWPTSRAGERAGPRKKAPRLYGAADSLIS